MEKVLEITHEGTYFDHTPLIAARFGGFVKSGVVGGRSLYFEQIGWLDKYFKLKVVGLQYVRVVINSCGQDKIVVEERIMQIRSIICPFLSKDSDLSSNANISTSSEDMVEIYATMIGEHNFKPVEKYVPLEPGSFQKKMLNWSIDDLNLNGESYGVGPISAESAKGTIKIRSLFDEGVFDGKMQYQGLSVGESIDINMGVISRALKKIKDAVGYETTLQNTALPSATTGLAFPTILSKNLDRNSFTGAFVVIGISVSVLAGQQANYFMMFGFKSRQEILTSSTATLIVKCRGCAIINSIGLNITNAASAGLQGSVFVGEIWN